MRVHSSRGVGGYATGEGHILVRALWKGRGQRAIICCHPRNHDHTIGVAGNTALPSFAVLMRNLATYGYDVLSIDAGGVDTWGNHTSTDRVNDAVNYIQGTVWGSASGKVGLIGVSMGNVVAMNYAREQPTKVSAIASIIGACDLAYHYNNGYSAAIDTAYSPSYAIHGDHHDPVKFAASIKDNFKWKGWYAQDDALIAPSTVTALATAMSANGSTHNLGNLGHTDTAIAAVSVPDLASFFASGIW